MQRAYASYIRCRFSGLNYRLTGDRCCPPESELLFCMRSAFQKLLSLSEVACETHRESRSEILIFFKIERDENFKAVLSAEPSTHLLLT